MQRVSMIRLEENDWAELFRFWQTPAFSQPSVGSLRRKFFVSLRPPPNEVPDALCKVPCFADVEASEGKALWSPSLCWDRDAFRDATLLVSSEEGAQALFVFFAYQTHQTALFFCHCEDSTLLHLR